MLRPGGALVALPELFGVTTSDALLGGSIPVRAARACTPFLVGNAAGARLSLRSPLTLRRRLGRITAEVPREIVERFRGTAPMLARAGLLQPWLARRFAAGPCVVSRGRVDVLTGVFVAPRDGEIVRVGHAGNRRPVTVDVEERLLGGGEGPVAVVLTLSLARGVDAATLVGELGSLTRLSPARVEEADDALSAGLAARHAEFFDAAYFADKRRAPTKKYAKRARRAASGDGAAPAPARIARLSLPQLAARELEVVGASGGVVATTTALELRAAHDVEARYDGHTLSASCEPRAHEAYAARVSRGYRRLLPHEAHEGARLYLAKYATPHQPGEPFFFVKPPELVETSPGASTLLVGALGDGWEALSAVLETDWFHALPAVLRVHRVGAVARVAKGELLYTAYPTSRSALAASLEVSTWDPFS
ncbi:MAG: hypothetical protein IT374_09740 [Polyangiaceae bacterium]|nr:hypothetical protein [Polyangiaceae bacterium]